MAQDVRRLAAIVSADVAGYSRLMGRDESGTLRRLNAHRSELIDPLIEEHSGRIVKTTGDGLLLEFPSVVAAVQCSVDAQKGMVERNADVSDDDAIRFRFGVHLGDVIVEGDDIFGDGVNVAARIEALAEPGSIAVSDDAHRQVRDRIDVQWLDGGEHEVKNIARPVHVWRWSIPVRQSINNGLSDDEPLPLPVKPSIVILPFDNMSGDPEQEYFADGITEDVITELSRFGGLFVIARNTAFTFKGQKIEVPKVAAELGVRFALEGSVRKVGNRVRITAQLIDGEDGSHLWAERYDGNLEDVFELQDDVTRQVVASVAPQIDKAELDRINRGERRFDEAYDVGWQAMAKFNRAMSSGDLQVIEEAIDLGKQAVSLNEKCSVGYIAVVASYSMQNLFSWGDDPVGAADRALDWAERAMSALPQTAAAYMCLGYAHIRKADFEQALRDFQRAHEINPNNAQTLFSLAFCHACLGNSENARIFATEAVRISPKDSTVPTAYLSIAMAAFIERDHEEFFNAAQRAILGHPKAPIRRALMIAFAAEIADEALLKTHLDALNSFSPGFVASLFRGENRLFAKDEHMNMLLDGLRKAGLAEE